MSVAKLAVSILAADFAKLGEQVAAAEDGGADWIHVDVMDGHFVPSISLGPAICKAARDSTKLPIDVHLMVSAPERHLEAFADAGANLISVHWEVSAHLHRTVERIRELGVRPGVVVNPATPVSVLEEMLPLVDLVLVMSVNPGWGGQRFIPSSVAKIERVREMIAATGGRSIEIEVDGGISPETAGAVVAAGASVLVAGSAVYNAKGTVAKNLAALRVASGA